MYIDDSIKHLVGQSKPGVNCEVTLF